jgi:beta-galactosidase
VIVLNSFLFMISISTNFKHVCFLFFFSIIILFSGCTTQTESNRSEVFAFDDQWKFLRDSISGAETTAFRDTTWRNLNLPHDWSIEDLPGTNSPFDSTAVSAVSGGFTVGGVGWYRKHFNIPNMSKGKRVHIQFDGVYKNAEVWCNGNPIGKHAYGYTSFWYDLTNHIVEGENIIAVRVDNKGLNSRWYSGSGIYRHVWLRVLNSVHCQPWGVSITADSIDTNSASLHIRTSVNNESLDNEYVLLNTRIVDALGNERMVVKSEREIRSKETLEFVQHKKLNQPQLWSIESPYRYKAITEILVDNQVVETVENYIGIRSLQFTVDKGFLLNNKPVELKGGCVHHDHGPLGAKSYDRAEERKVELLKASGYNAIRCSHNPPAPAFLEACDRLGMLVIDEAFDLWNLEKNPYDYHLDFDAQWKADVKSMIDRDRNHPSIIMWSIGNEVPDMDSPATVEVCKALVEHVKSLDTSRPVTAAVHNISDMKDPFFSNLDISGYNYGRKRYEEDHARKPERVIYASESYPLEAFEYWQSAKKHPYVLGDFVWTAFDYIGEASIGWRGYWHERNFYPWNLAFCGDIDICGWKRPQSYYRDVLWGDTPVVFIAVKPPTPSFPVNAKKMDWSIWNWHDAVSNWNWNEYEGKLLEVNVYASCAEVELFLNDLSLGKKKSNEANRFSPGWNVPYQKGSLRAVGYDAQGNILTEQILSTAELPVALKLSADRKFIDANGQDLSYITVELIDAKGNRHPQAENLITFQVEGEGILVGVGNANPMSLESYQAPLRKAWQGRCMVVLKSTGKPGIITLIVSGEKFSEQRIDIQSKIK